MKTNKNDTKQKNDTINLMNSNIPKTKTASQYKKKFR